MKVYLAISFDYEERPEIEQEKVISEIIDSFLDFCDDNQFDFQCIPRIGEEIVAEELLQKWLENKKYRKPCSESEVRKKFYSILISGTFVVTGVSHHLKSCTVECTDIQMKN